MKTIVKVKKLCMAWLVLAGVMLSTNMAQAETVTKKVVAQTGDAYNIYNAQNLKINNKKISKYKKKIKVTKYENSEERETYYPYSYFKTADAYPTQEAYQNAIYGGERYFTKSTYQLYFLKKGTYSVSYNQYHLQEIKAVQDGNTGRYFIWIEGQKQSEPYERIEDLNMGIYYQGINTHTIYAVGREGMTRAVIAKGADGKNHLRYDGKKRIKDTYTTIYKVLGSGWPIEFYKLGKSGTSVKKTMKKTGYTYKRKENIMLSGNSGKLTIKTSDKNYVINSIIVETYDKDGKPVFTSVRNKSKIKYGTNRANRKYQGAGYSYETRSTYKPTIIHVGYTDKFRGEYSKYSVVTVKDETGAMVQAIKSVYKDGEDSKEETVVTPGGGFAGPCHHWSTFYKK